MSSCPWESCVARDLFTLPPDSRPDVRSSLFEFRQYALHEWKHRALHDDAVEHALRNAVCCFKRNMKATPPYPHTCFVADAEDHKVRLPPQCGEGMNLHPCVCRVLPTRHFYCEGARVDGTMPNVCARQALGRDIECSRDNRVVARTNSAEMAIPQGCQLRKENGAP